MKGGSSVAARDAKRTGKRNVNNGKPAQSQKSKDEDEEERRRERARESQRNFHLRRQAKFTTLEQRIDSLEETVDQMSNEFIGFGDRAVSVAEPSSKSLILDDLKRTTERFLDLARAAESPSDQEEEGSSESMSSKRPRVDGSTADNSSSGMNVISTGPMSVGLGNPFDPFDFDALFATATPSLIPHSVRQVDPQHRSQIYSSFSGKFSPRLDYGFFGTGTSSLVPNPSPETPWMTYVISGRNSFALRLYLDTTVLIFNVLRGVLSVPGLIPMVCRFRLRHERPQTLLEKLRYQFGKMHIDTNNIESAISTNSQVLDFDSSEDSSLILFGPNDYEMLDQLLLKVVRDYTQELGGSLEDWLDPWATQQYLRTNWGLQLSSEKLQTSAQTIRYLELPASSIVDSGLNDPSFPSPETDLPEIRWWDTSSSQEHDSMSSFVPNPQVHLYDGLEDVELSSQQLARKLTFHAMCFGEGPRYPVSGIDQAVRELLAEAYLPSSIRS